MPCGMNVSIDGNGSAALAIFLSLIGGNRQQTSLPAVSRAANTGSHLYAFQRLAAMRGFTSSASSDNRVERSRRQQSVTVSLHHRDGACRTVADGMDI